MRAALMYGAGDVRIETVPDPTIEQPTDALVRIVRAWESVWTPAGEEHFHGGTAENMMCH